MRRSAAETAILVGTLLNRSGEKRARVSYVTLRRLSGRSLLRVVFLEQLKTELDDLGLVFVETDRGFAVMRAAALNGAPAITAKRFLPEALDDHEGRRIDFERLREEINAQDTDNGDERE